MQQQPPQCRLLARFYHCLEADSENPCRKHPLHVCSQPHLPVKASENSASVSWPALNIALKPSFRSPSPPTPVRCKNKYTATHWLCLVNWNGAASMGSSFMSGDASLPGCVDKSQVAATGKECRRIWSSGGKTVFKSQLELDLRSHQFSCWWWSSESEFHLSGMVWFWQWMPLSLGVVLSGWQRLPASFVSHHADESWRLLCRFCLFLCPFTLVFQQLLPYFQFDSHLHGRISDLEDGGWWYLLTGINSWICLTGMMSCDSSNHALHRMPSTLYNNHSYRHL